MMYFKKNYFLILLAISLSNINLCFAQQHDNAYPLKLAIWKDHHVPVCWENPSRANANARKQVQQAIKNSWETVCDIRFVEWGSCSDKEFDKVGIHILINDEIPHTVNLGNKINGLDSGMVLNFTYHQFNSECLDFPQQCYEAHAIHEFGHALCFAHEQNRKNCDWGKCFIDTVKSVRGHDGDMDDVITFPCDKKSIMNYCNPNRNNGELSDGDKAAAAKLYPRLVDNAMAFSPHKVQVNYIYTAERQRRNFINRKFYVMVQGPSSVMNEIQEVVHHIHPTFPDPVIPTDDRDEFFGILLTRVWGEFDDTVVVNYKNGTKDTIIKELNFESDLGVSVDAQGNPIIDVEDDSQRRPNLEVQQSANPSPLNQPPVNMPGRKDGFFNPSLPVNVTAIMHRRDSVKVFSGKNITTLENQVNAILQKNPTFYVNNISYFFSEGLHRLLVIFRIDY